MEILIENYYNWFFKLWLDLKILYMATLPYIHLNTAPVMEKFILTLYKEYKIGFEDNLDHLPSKVYIFWRKILLKHLIPLSNKYL